MSNPTTAVTKLKKARGVYRRQATKTENEAQIILENYEIENIDKLTALRNSYLDKLNKIKSLDDQILELLEEEDYEQELDTNIEYHDRTYEIIAKMERLMKQPQPAFFLFIPLLTEKLPNELKVIITRRFYGGDWRMS